MQSKIIIDEVFNDFIPECDYRGKDKPATGIIKDLELYILTLLALTNSDTITITFTKE